MAVTDDIKARLNIVEVVASYVPNLSQSGRTFKAVCPFHTERTPSFIVNPERQSWRCFGACSDGGDIFNFVMRAENMQFGDALRLLARRAGVELQSSGERSRADAIHSVNMAAASYYQDVLKSDSGKFARDYLDQRGVGDGARQRFKLGLSPSGWDGLTTYLHTHDVKLEDAVDAGLVRQGDNGRSWDFFRGRLMFPIFDRDGNVAGFGARSLDDSDPKYINTAQTDVFDKRNMLYALNFAVPTIRQTGTAVIVEGYMDAIAAHEHGYTNVVASMGTALTENQVSQLRSLAQDFVLALDPDAAGQEATLRSLESSWSAFVSTVTGRAPRRQGVTSGWKPPALKIAALPSGLDPDALIRTDTEGWDAAVAGALPLLDFVIPAAVERADLSTPGNRAHLTREILPLINALDDFDQYAYLDKLANLIGVPVEWLSGSIRRSGTRGGRGRRDRSPADQEPQVEVSPRVLSQGGSNPLEDFALALLLRRPDLIELVAGVSPVHFRQTENRQLFTALLACPTIEELRETVDPLLLSHIDRLEATQTADVGQAAQHRSDAALFECMRRIELRYLYEMQETFLETDGVDQPPSRDIAARVQQVNHRISELQSPSAERR